MFVGEMVLSMESRESGIECWETQSGWAKRNERRMNFDKSGENQEKAIPGTSKHDALWCHVVRFRTKERPLTSAGR